MKKLCILHDDGLQNISSIFALVRSRLQSREYFFHLNNLHRVFFILKKLSNGHIKNIIRMILYAVNFNACFFYSINVFDSSQAMDTFMKLFSTLEYKLRQFNDGVIHLGYFIKFNSLGR